MIRAVPFFFFGVRAPSAGPAARGEKGFGLARGLRDKDSKLLDLGCPDLREILSGRERACQG